MDPLNVRPLRKSRSLRHVGGQLLREVREILGNESHENQSEQNSTTITEGSLRSQSGPLQREAPAGDRRCSRPILDNRQKMLYSSCFKLYFGVSDEMGDFLEDFCNVVAPSAERYPIADRMKKQTRDAQERFGLQKFYHCFSCDNLLTSSKALCRTEGCPMQRVAPKPSKNSKRTTIYTLQIQPQLALILQRVLPLLIELHGSIHFREESNENPVLSDTSSFPKYKQDIELRSDFENKKISIVLSLNFDGVKFKKLSRSESWPVYIRLEGLPFMEKNKYENIILGGILFARKTPTEALLSQLFRRLKDELTALQIGIPIIQANATPSSTWICTPKLKNGIIDFSALHLLYKLPRWLSLQGCHLCVFPGERVDRRVIWFNRNPLLEDRRTDSSLLTDADLHQNGVTGRTQMSDLFTVNHCMPDALHLLSEGITINVFKAMFQSRHHSMAIRSECVHLLHAALRRTRNYTYSSKLILSLDDLSRCTGSEKDALSFVVFPLAAATNMFTNPVAAVSVLSYWVVVRKLEKTTELTALDLQGICDLANLMKLLWYEIEPTMITFKVHCFVDHAIREDLRVAGSPYNWTLSNFESIHRRLQLRIPQCTTNVEEKLINNFLLHKDLTDKLRKEVEMFENEHLDRLYAKMSQAGDIRGLNVTSNVQLSDDWYVPAKAILPYEDLSDEHRVWMATHSSTKRFSSRAFKGHHVYSSSHYWRRPMDTVQDSVYLVTGDGEPRYGRIIVFCFDPCSLEFFVLMEELKTADPFLLLDEAVRASNHSSKDRACSALRKITDKNCYFKHVISRQNVVCNAYHIKSSAVLVNYCDSLFVSRT